VYSDAWLEILAATPKAESFGHEKGRTLPLSVVTPLELNGHVIVPAGVHCDESPEELRGRPWKKAWSPAVHATYARVYWGPGWRIGEAETLNDERIDARHVNLVPGDVVTTPRGELTLELCAR
jgi:hypothetical protein